MGYEVIVERKAREALARPPSTVYDRMRVVNDPSEEQPRPRQSLSLRGRPGRRLRAGDYRVVHLVDDGRQGVFGAEVWHRQRDYR